MVHLSETGLHLREPNLLGIRASSSVLTLFKISLEFLMMILFQITLNFILGLLRFSYGAWLGTNTPLRFLWFLDALEDQVPFSRLVKTQFVRFKLFPQQFN